MVPWRAEEVGMRSRLRIVVVVIAALALPVALLSCSDTPGTVGPSGTQAVPGGPAAGTAGTAGTARDGGSWAISALSIPVTSDPSDAVRTPSVRSAWRDGDVMSVATDTGVFSSTDGSTWAASLTPPVPSGPRRRVSWSFNDHLLLDDGRVLLVGSSMGPGNATANTASSDGSSDNYRAAVWTSTDHGRSWQAIPSPAFDVQAEMGAVASSPHGLVGVGAHRPNGGSGPFEPALWTSPDAGDTWVETPLDSPSFAGDTYFTSVVALNDAVVIGGRRNFKPALWTSTDLVTWTEVGPDLQGDVRLAATGGRLIAMTGGSSPSSADQPVGWMTSDLRQWDPILRDPAVFGDATNANSFNFVATSFSVSQWNGRFVLRGSVPVRSDPQFCFQDLATCQQVTDFVATSADGTTWQRVAAEDRGTAGESTTFTAVVEGSDPVALVAKHLAPPPPNHAGSSSGPNVTADLQLWRWSVAGTFPPGIAASIPTTATPAFPLLPAKNPDLAVGATARVQWFTGGCGGSGFTIGGRTFVATPPGLPALQPDWPARKLQIADGPSIMVLGTLTRPSEDELVFTVEGTATSVTLVPGSLGGCF
jgi:hypothetical protein